MGNVHVRGLERKDLDFVYEMTLAECCNIAMVDVNRAQQIVTRNFFYKSFVTIINFGLLFARVERMGKCNKLLCARDSSSFEREKGKSGYYGLGEFCYWQKRFLSLYLISLGL